MSFNLSGPKLLSQIFQEAVFSRFWTEYSS